jgi:hypothetical protein
MLKVMFALLLLASAGVAQSSSDGSFSVHNSKHENSSLSAAQMHEAESLYQSACGAVQNDFHSAAELHPRFTVIIGAERNEVHSAGMKVDDSRVQIWMKKWNPTVFAQGVVVLAFQELLTRDLITQLGNRAVSYSNATVDVAGLK